jgi:excisionase family DNA binding protein
MATIHPAVTGRKVGANLEPLAVSPRQACVLLGIGNTRLYELIGAGELVAYKEGRARRITMQSIRARFARLTAAVAPSNAAATPPRRGRPPKKANAAVSR